MSILLCKPFNHATQAIAVGTYGTFLIILAPLMVAYFYILKFVRHTSIEVQRLEANARSPVYSTFSEILQGLPIVRAYNQQARFQVSTMLGSDGCFALAPSALLRTLFFSLSGNAKQAPQCPLAAVFHCPRGAQRLAAVAPERSWRNNRFCGRVFVHFHGHFAHWLGSRHFDLLFNGDAFPFLCCFHVYRSRGSSWRLGVRLLCVLLVPWPSSLVVFSSMQVSMNSVERIKYYAENLDEEAPEEIEDTAPPPEWPAQGRVEIKDLRIGYRTGPDVIKGISVTVEPAEKVGVVGRTGSGKSTLLLSIFRIMEARGGQIIIDGIDIATIGLLQLRSKIGIIPQVCVAYVQLHQVCCA